MSDRDANEGVLAWPSEPPKKKQKTAKAAEEDADLEARPLKRHMCTINFSGKVPPPADVPAPGNERISYCCWSTEISPSTIDKPEDERRYHLQVYIEVFSRVRMRTIRKEVPWLAHAYIDPFPCAGSSLECKEYVQKMREIDIISREQGVPNYPPPSSDFHEFGKFSYSGPEDKRAKGKEVCELIARGAITFNECADKYPSLFQQWWRTWRQVEANYLTKISRTEKTAAIWLWGKSGSGKSHLANKLARAIGSVYYAGSDAKKGWYDMYSRQDVFLFDEFRIEHIPYDDMLRLADKYHHDLARRGVPAMPFTSRLIIITCCSHPDELYKYNRAVDHYEQFQRRYDVYEVTEANRDIMYAELLEKYKIKK